MKNDLLHQRECFNRRAENYYRTRNGDKQLLLRDLMYGELLKDVKIEKEKILVLEPMCGYGEGKRILETHFGNRICYEGFDYSDEIVKYAKEYLGDINVYVQDVTTFSSNKKYDVIIIMGGFIMWHRMGSRSYGICQSCLTETVYLLMWNPHIIISYLSTCLVLYTKKIKTLMKRQRGVLVWAN